MDTHRKYPRMALTLDHFLTSFVLHRENSVICVISVTSPYTARTLNDDPPFFRSSHIVIIVIEKGVWMAHTPSIPASNSKPIRALVYACLFVGLLDVHWWPKIGIFAEQFVERLWTKHIKALYCKGLRGMYGGGVLRFKGLNSCIT